jgi:hypothetical protein
MNPSASTPVVAAILGGSDSHAAEKASAPAPGTALDTAHRKIEKELGAVKWGVVRRMVLDNLAAQIKDPIFDCVTGAWKKVDELAEYAEETRRNPDKPKELVLGEHTIKTEYSPEVVILVRDTEIGRINAHITLSLKIQGLILVIKEGRIVRLRGGTCQPSGRIEVEKQLVYEKKLDPVDVLLDLPLPKPVEIAARGAPTATPSA